MSRSIASKYDPSRRPFETVCPQWAAAPYYHLKLMKQRRELIRNLMRAQVRKGCVRAARESGLLSLDAGGLTFEPWFQTGDRGIVCQNEPLLGFYGLVACARGAFRAVNFLVAGHRSLSVELFAPAIGLFYTAAYHALHAYLGMDGRVIFDSPHWTDASGDTIEAGQSRNYPQSLVAILKKDNTWGFEPRKRGHQWKWQELRQVFGTTDGDIPEFLHALFYELYGQRFRKGTNLREILRDPERYRVTISEVLSEFLTMIADTRHAALYTSIGINPSLTEAIVNGDRVPVRGEGGERARAIGAFAYAMLACSTRDIVEQLKALKLTQPLEERLAIRIFDPWADPPRIQLLPKGVLRESLRAVDKVISRQFRTKRRSDSNARSGES